LTSATGTNAQSVEKGKAITDITYSLTNVADGDASVTWLPSAPAGITAVQSGTTFTILGTAPDVSAETIYTYTVKLKNVCGTVVDGPTGTITVTVPSPGILIGGSFSRTTGSGNYATYRASDWTSNGDLEVAASNTSTSQNWTTAMNACPSGWRLPNIRELRFIYETWGTTGAPAGITQMTSSIYWSSTEENENYSKIVWFNAGNVNSSPKTNDTLYVRCVRNL
jgi:hypothetical protein